MKTLREMWLASCRHNVNDLAVACGDTRRTYGQVLDRARRLASALSKAGVRRQDRVSAYATNCPEWVDIYAACHLSGYIVGTVNFRLAGPEVQYILGDSKPTVLIFEDKFTGVVDSLRPSLEGVVAFVCIGQAPDWAVEFETFLASGDPAGPANEAKPDDIAHLIYTSGTTGRPKGVMRSQRAEVCSAQSVAIGMNMRQDGSILLVMPLFHIGALAEALGMILVGGALHIHRTFDPANVLAAVQKERISYLHLAPTMVQALFDVPNFASYDLSSIQVLCYSAAPMSVTLLKKSLRALGPVMLDMYGGTEMGPVCGLYRHRHKIDGSEIDTIRLGSVGQTFPAYQVRIVDDSGREMPPGVTGEIVVASEGLMTGYWNNSVATLEALRDGWYYTGDMGKVDEEGYIFLVDRKKDMIVSGGENIYCREVEEALMEHGSLADVAVIGVPDERWGEAVKAIAIRKPEATATADDIIAFCKQRIARYKSPKSIEFVDELPRLPSGKVSKVKLREMFGA